MMQTPDYVYESCRNKHTDDNDLCPTGFTFMTNISYGLNLDEDKTEYYQNFITTLQNHGFLIQVADATDVFGNYFSTPLYQSIAVYVKRADGQKTNIQDAWNATKVK